jgi:histidinol-phosphate aminotransferase
VGWLYGPSHVVDALTRIRGPFNVNAAAIAAATAAIRDRDHVAMAVAHNDKWLAKTTEGLQQLGLEVTPSIGNFVLVHFSTEPGKTAGEAEQFLCERGYVLRGVGGYGLPNALRMSIGVEEANLGVISALKQFLGADV